MKNHIVRAAFLIVAGTVFFSCTALVDALKEPPVPPTRDRMMGVWRVTEALNENDSSILEKIDVPVTALYFQTDNTVLSTAGPMTMYLVYGGSKFVQIAGTVDQVFKYANLNFTNGEFFVNDGNVDRFTLEMKLQGVPGQSTLTTLLGMLGVNNQYFETVIYHKFTNVKVDFPVIGLDTAMTWTFDDSTKAIYNKKDGQGNYVTWAGWPTTTFSKCKFTFQKQQFSLSELVQSAVLTKNRKD